MKTCFPCLLLNTGTYEINLNYPGGANAVIPDIKQITLMPKNTDNVNVDVVQRLKIIHLIGLFANGLAQIEDNFAAMVIWPWGISTADLSLLGRTKKTYKRHP